MQQIFDCIRLHFSSPLHLSKGKTEYDESTHQLHSDTIGSALFVAALQLGASGQEALAMLDGVRLSSAFPFSGDHHFFPRPMARLPFEIQKLPEEKRGKVFKKIRYLDQIWFERILHAEAANIDRNHHLFGAYLAHTDPGPVYTTEVTQRVTIAPDHSEDSDPFYTERLYFAPKAGLYFLTTWLDEAVKPLFQRSLRLLGDMGIGTDKAVGNGFFSPELGRTLALRVPEQASHQCNLGLYLPAPGEVDALLLDGAAWALVQRGGYMAGATQEEHRALRKKTVFLFDTGSVLPNKPLLGQRVDLQPKWNAPLHPVWRDGRTLFIPFTPAPPAAY